MTPNLALHHKLLEATRRIRLLLVLQWVGRTLWLGPRFWSHLARLAARLDWLETPAPATVTVIPGRSPSSRESGPGLRTS